MEVIGKSNRKIEIEDENLEWGWELGQRVCVCAKMNYPLILQKLRRRNVVD